MLPIFRSSELVGALQHAGTGSGLTMNEISYSLDAGAARPYLRYQVSLSVVGAYPVVRRFIDDIVLEMPNLALDSITCSRDDIAATRPVCDLSFSSFYRKDVNG
jgi:Tfp pilus assembly protein PilO